MKNLNTMFFYLGTADISISWSLRQSEVDSLPIDKQGRGSAGPRLTGYHNGTRKWT